MIYRCGQQFVADLLASETLVYLSVINDKPGIADFDIRHFSKAFAVFLYNERAASAFFYVLNIHNDSFPQSRKDAKGGRRICSS